MPVAIKEYYVQTANLALQEVENINVPNVQMLGGSYSECSSYS